MPARVNDPRNWQEAHERDHALIAERIQRRAEAKRQAQKREALREAWAMGLTVREAAKQAGYRSSGSAARALECLERESQRGCASESEWIQRERRRLLLRNEMVARALYPRARAGDVEAIDRLIKLDERRARLLGVDAPQRTEVSGPGGGPVPLAEVAALREAVFTVLDQPTPEARELAVQRLLAVETPPTNGQATPRSDGPAPP